MYEVQSYKQHDDPKGHIWVIYAYDVHDVTYKQPVTTLNHSTKAFH